MLLAAIKAFAASPYYKKHAGLSGMLSPLSADPNGSRSILHNGARALVRAAIQQIEAGYLAGYKPLFLLADGFAVKEVVSNEIADFR